MEGASKNMKSFTSKLKPEQLRSLFFVLGLGLFSYLILKLNPSLLWDHLRKVGFNFLWVLIPSTLSYIAYALAWEIFLKRINPHVSLGRIFRIKVSGEAVNSVTPLSWGGGDPARIYLLKSHVPMRQGTASVVVDRTLNNLAVALFMILGVLLALIKFKLPLEIKLGLFASLLVITGVSVFFYFRSHEGLFEFFIDVLKKLRIKRHFSDKTMERVREVDHHISDFYRRNKKGFIQAFGLHFFSRLQSPVEIYLAAKFLGFPMHLLDCYLLGSLTVLVNMIFVFVPGGIGVMEGAYAGTFSLFQQDPLMGASIQLVRRMRMLLWTAIGFFFMYQTRQHKPAMDQKPISM